MRKLRLVLLMKGNECTIIIPARYDSTRFPGKPLELLCGTPMIEWVYKHASAFTPNVFVATDSAEIADVVTDFGGKVVMSQTKHENGSQRVFEAFAFLQQQGIDSKYVIDLQADEPLVLAKDLKELIDTLEKSDAPISTLVSVANSLKEIKDENIVKVVIDAQFCAMYFSRSVIPHIDKRWDIRQRVHSYLKHVGAYAFRSEIVGELYDCMPGLYTIEENLEQLTWMENGYRIRVGLVDKQIVGINVPADIPNVERALRRLLREERKWK